MDARYDTPSDELWTTSRAYSSFRSSRASLNYPSLSHISKGLGAFAIHSSASGRATALEVIINVLHETRLPGPLFIHPGQWMIGQGSQFAVYERDMHIAGMAYAVAVKCPCSISIRARGSAL
jgi:hypothetical protein